MDSAARGNLLVLALLVPGFRPQEKADERPNILFILTDDQRPDAMRCYGNSSVRTPNFDALASEGARFDQFYTASPLGSPSRASFLSGLYPHQTGVLDNSGADLPRDAPTVATRLAAAGYATGFVGKAQLGGDPRRWGFRETPLWLPGAASRHRNPRLMVDGVDREVHGEITPLFADAAIAFIEKHKEHRWFLWLAPTAPHTPYLMSPEHAYKADEIRPPPLWPHNEEFSEQDWAGYYSTISMLDEQMGRVLARLKEQGLFDRTFIFAASDNGFMHGSHGYAAKETWYEEAARVPALARWPAKIRPGTRVYPPVSSVDLLPTLCEIAGAPAPEGREASSMMPALQGKMPLRRLAFAEVRTARDGTWQMVRTEQYKYVRFDHGREHLFDLWSDSDEVRDLAVRVRDVDTLLELRGHLKTWMDMTPK